MRKLISILFAVAAITTASCTKSSCDDCTQRKREFCIALREYGCNSAALTQYIDEMARYCGQSQTDQYISEATLQCTQGTIVCPECQ